MSTKLTNAQIKDLVLALTTADKVTYSSKDNSFTAKRYFFYKHGMTAKKFAEHVAERIPGIEILGYSEDWKPWPKDSYFNAKFTVINSLVLLVKYNETTRE